MTALFSGSKNPWFKIVINPCFGQEGLPRFLYLLLLLFVIVKKQHTSAVPLRLSLHFSGHFPGEPGLASFIEAKDDGVGGDNWSYMACKAPVKSSPPTNQHPTFYRPDALPVAQPTVSKH